MRCEDLLVRASREILSSREGWASRLRAEGAREIPSGRRLVDLGVSDLVATPRIFEIVQPSRTFNPDDLRNWLL